MNFIQSRRARNYALVHSELSRLERDRASALQGNYKCTSCPICLEDFKSVGEGENIGLGSDSLPLKLLRCGHVFDTTCFTQWVSQGSGDVRRCPICNQNVGAPENNQTNDVNQNVRQRQVARVQLEQERAQRIEVFERERDFRMMRIQRRFPRVVNVQQIQQWSKSGYDGSMERIPSITRSTESTPGQTSFGGGSSGGGGGGRW
eukprot:CAMPEP_0118684568 /NCGR_PEP_ID=MMETSP0800-20121206/6724_1 /TAXON_ID=210618 ORGANISM="Striatella unipunctata, Strain CCMP2910" /NCGR_SAMPLE_ID=MMETSP0800 /ASSEMBLY_ACC=CAM_ASM_000638 /LENGTH=203 /DNA_ID=CAMNT_0006581305 /DNA_START=195 /DNA_END=806 /DNA_ORIENTATION=-